MEEKDLFLNSHRIALVIPCVLFPYAILLFLYLLMIDQTIIETVFMNDALLPLGILILFLSVAFFLSVLTAIAALVNHWDAAYCAKMVFFVKLLQIPAYILIFILGVLFFITIFTFAFSIAFVIFDVVLIIMTGLMGTSAAVRAYKEDMCTFGQMVLLSIAQYIFCVDVFASLYLYLKTRKAQQGKEVLN